jgi:predicted RNA binding protein YcfA (HicA-like mRNA interferase family)
MGSKQTVPTKLFKKFLINQGLELIRTKGGHESWHKKGLLRPVVVQTHKKEIPESVLRSNLRTLGVSMKEFIEIISTL